MGCLGKRFTAKAIHINARFRCQPQINSSYSLSTCDFVFKSARSWENGAFACENELNQHPKAPIISKDIQTASFICLHLSEVLLQFREAKGEVNLFKKLRFIHFKVVQKYGVYLASFCVHFRTTDATLHLKLFSKDQQLLNKLQHGTLQFLRLYWQISEQCKSTCFIQAFLLCTL